MLLQLIKGFDYRKVSAGQKTHVMTEVSSRFRTASSTKASGFGILASMAACAGATLAVGLAPAPVQAQVVLDKTTGTWSNPVGGSGVNYQTVGAQN
jgi:hypothetical protein